MHNWLCLCVGNCTLTQSVRCAKLCMQRQNHHYYSYYDVVNFEGDNCRACMDEYRTLQQLLLTSLTVLKAIGTQPRRSCMISLRLMNYS